MTPRAKKLITAIVLIDLLCIALFFWWSAKPTEPQQLSFVECKEHGGTPWNVDIFHPDFCPQCSGCNSCIGSTDASCTPEPCDLNCAACFTEHSPYPEKCPDDKEKLGNIWDASIPFLCCKG